MQVSTPSSNICLLKTAFVWDRSSVDWIIIFRLTLRLKFVQLVSRTSLSASQRTQLMFICKGQVINTVWGNNRYFNLDVPLLCYWGRCRHSLYCSVRTLFTPFHWRSVQCCSLDICIAISHCYCYIIGGPIWNDTA